MDSFTGQSSVLKPCYVWGNSSGDDSGHLLRFPGGRSVEGSFIFFPHSAFFSNRTSLFCFPVCHVSPLNVK